MKRVHIISVDTGNRMEKYSDFQGKKRLLASISTDVASSFIYISRKEPSFYINLRTDYTGSEMTYLGLKISTFVLILVVFFVYLHSCVF